MPIPLPPLRWLPLFLAPALAAAPAWAQQQALGQAENIRYEYAQVLRAEPVYQTLRATSMVERCEQSSMVAPEEGEERRGLSRVVGAVRDVLTPNRRDQAPDADGDGEGDCVMVPVEREYRRPVAYDVDYVVRGVKYRSRLPQDPGNRLRVKVSVVPVVPGGDAD